MADYTKYPGGQRKGDNWNWGCVVILAALLVFWLLVVAGSHLLWD